MLAHCPPWPVAYGITTLTEACSAVMLHDSSRAHLARCATSWLACQDPAEPGVAHGCMCAVTAKGTPTTPSTPSTLGKGSVAAAASSDAAAATSLSSSALLPPGRASGAGWRLGSCKKNHGESQRAGWSSNACCTAQQHAPVLVLAWAGTDSCPAMPERAETPISEAQPTLKGLQHDSAWPLERCSRQRVHALHAWLAHSLALTRCKQDARECRGDAREVQGMRLQVARQQVSTGVVLRRHYNACEEAVPTQLL
jgi:hypothetical protein